MIEIRRNPLPSGRLEIVLSGRLDGDGAARLEAEMEDVVRAGSRNVVLRTSEVPCLSSAGIRALISGWKRMGSLGGTFVLVDPSEAVRKVLDLAGLAQLLERGKEDVTGTFHAVTADPHPPARVAVGPGVGTLYTLDPGARLAGRTAGDPGKLATGAFGPSDGVRLRLGRGTFGLGLGAFGEGFGDCRGRYGEFLAADGASVCLPSDGARRPDDQVARGELVPEVEVLYAITFEGAFSHLLRFRPGKGGEPVPLSALVATGVDTYGGEPFGFVAVAESAGLVGASLRSSPVGREGSDPLFSHESARAHFSFTPVREHDRGTVLAVGVAGRRVPEPLAPFLRPLSRAGERSGLLAHVHAAAFTFRALPDGVLPLPSTVSSLFEEQHLVTLLHLLDDDRDISGSGESVFLSGGVWMAPLLPPAGPARGETP